MRKPFFAIVAITFALSWPVFGQQAGCERKILRDSQAKEILRGPEYEIFLTVAAAFGRNAPRLYFVPRGTNAVYIAGSAAFDGRGKILMSRAFVELMGVNTPTLRGIMAHEMAHAALDRGETDCSRWIMRNPALEKEADALAARRVGFEPVLDFLSRAEKLMEARSGELEARIGALEKLEDQGSRQR